jgi:hypothetical protein
MSKAKFSSVEQILKFLQVAYEKEHRFHPTRKWRFDYALPHHGVAIEYEGLYSRRSRHTSVRGFREDCVKYNEAALYGWVLIRVTNDMLRSGVAVDFIYRAINLKN